MKGPFGPRETQDHTIGVNRMHTLFTALVATLLAIVFPWSSIPLSETPAPQAVDVEKIDAYTYRVEVDIANQITTVYRNADDAVVRQMICSTGKDGSTPLGTVRMELTRPETDRIEWYYIDKYECYVKYATRIRGPILFHSLPYLEKDLSTLDQQAVDELGTPASHGCIRLRVEDAEWIAKHCPVWTKVRIYDGEVEKPALREALLRQSFSENGGQTYGEFLAQAEQNP